MAACEICLELYDSEEHIPRILQCGHSLCEQCLRLLKLFDSEGNLSVDNPLCPKCRAPITLTRLDLVSKNFSLIENAVKKKVIYCPQHEDLGLEAILYCLKCKVYVCAKCIATSHNAHEFEDLDRRVRKVKETVQDLKLTAEEQKRKQAKLLESYYKKKEVVLLSQEQEKAAILSHFNKYIDKIAKERDEFVTTLEHMYRKDMDELESLTELARRRMVLVEKVMGNIKTFEEKIETLEDSAILSLEANNKELNDLKINTTNINFQFVPEHLLYKYQFEGREVVFPTSELGVISQELLDEFILLLGDSNIPGTPGFGTWTLTVASQSWESSAMDVALRSYSAACFVPEFQAVVITGGKDKTCVRSTQILYTSMKKSDTRSPMSTARDGHVCLYYEGGVYVFGGFNEDAGALDSCEMYTLDMDQWTEKSPMNVKRSMLGACICGREAYAFGGHNKGYLGSIERYTFEADVWHRLSVVLPYNAAGISACCFKDQIYLIGGCQSNASFNSVYCFDPLSSELKPAPDMSEKRAFAKVFPLGARLLVLGGGKNYSAEILTGDTWQSFISEGDPRSSLEKYTAVLLC